MTEMHRLELQRMIDAPPSAVFTAWTDPAVMSKWFAPDTATCGAIEADPRVGGRYRVEMVLPDGKSLFVGGEYLEVVPHTRLAFTWKWEHEAETTRVVLEFIPAGTLTDLRFVHERFASSASRDGHGIGWNNSLGKLAALLAQR